LLASLAVQCECHSVLVTSLKICFQFQNVSKFPASLSAVLVLG